LIDLSVTVCRTGVIAEPTATATTLGFDRAKHVGEIARVIAGVRHNARAKNVCFGLIFAAEPQERNGYRSLGGLPCSRPSEDRSQNAGNACAHRVLLRLGGLRRAVTQGHVTKLVGHHAGHFTFGTRGFDHPAINVHWPTRQSESVDVARIEHLEVITKLRMLEFRWNCSYQALPDAFNVSRDFSVAQQWKLSFGFGRCLPAKANIVTRLIFVGMITDFRLSKSG